MRIVPTLLAVGLVLSSVSAFAATKTNNQNKQPAASTAAPAMSSADHKYCIESGDDEATGSRIYTRECRTKAEWAKRGVDIDQMSKPE
jgi:hypothetical protein